jgi:hypothetical protein
MRPALAYFTFAEITDPTKHWEFNEYHQLDHRPENLALPGVIFGDRWVRTPDCARAVPTPDSDFSTVHYMTMYWLREPVEQSRREWMDFGTTATHLGRRPDLPWARRPLVAPFLPLKGYVNPRVLVSAEALPFRPCRGVYVTVSRLGGDLPAVQRLGRWYDRTRIPDLLGCAGVAGGWSFVSEDAFPARGPGGVAPASPGVRIQVLFLDGDPLEFARDLAERLPVWEQSGRGSEDAGAETPLFDAVLRTIVPWEWDWFDRPA